MSGTASTRFAAWMAAHEHRDATLGFVYRYHPRSDAHSKELCRLVLEDLIVACPSLRHHAEADQIVYGINCLYTFPVSGKTKTLDFVVAKGTPKERAERHRQRDPPGSNGGNGSSRQAEGQATGHRTCAAVLRE